MEILGEFPATPYVRIAVVEAAQWRWMVPAEWEYLRLGLCREAHEVGADAIVHPTMDPQSYSWNVGPLGHAGSTRKLVAIAIRYTGPAAKANADESD